MSVECFSWVQGVFESRKRRRKKPFNPLRLEGDHFLTITNLPETCSAPREAWISKPSKVALRKGCSGETVPLVSVERWVMNMFKSSSEPKVMLVKSSFPSYFTVSFSPAEVHTTSSIFGSSSSGEIFPSLVRSLTR